MGAQHQPRLALGRRPLEGRADVAIWQPCMVEGGPSAGSRVACMLRMALNALTRVDKTCHVRPLSTLTTREGGG